MKVPFALAIACASLLAAPAVAAAAPPITIGPPGDVEIHVPAGEVYQAVESPRGEMGYYIVSDGTAKPYRVHMRSPSFANLQLLPAMCEGRLIADVVAAIGSIDIVLGEIDR